MNQLNLVPFESAVQNKMTSLEIAQLTGKRHDAVLRDIRNLISQIDVADAHNFVEGHYVDRNGQKRPVYELSKKGCLCLASGYRADLRMAIINRWEELETKQQRLPQNYLEALEALVESEKAKQLLIKDNQEKQTLIESQKPKVLFADTVAGSKSSCLIGELAKMITQKGYEIGQNRLFLWLRQNHYLGSRGENYNIPNQVYIEQGLFELKEGTRSGDNGTMYTTITPKVTGKGQIYFINKFLGK